MFTEIIVYDFIWENNIQTIVVELLTIIVYIIQFTSKPAKPPPNPK